MSGKAETRVTQLLRAIGAGDPAAQDKLLPVVYEELRSLARGRMAAEAPKDASRAFLPTLRLSMQGLRTTDPVAVFGLKLRQENFAEEDLALDPLNRPDPYSGYNSSATVELPIYAPEGLFGHAASRLASPLLAMRADGPM